MTGFKFRKPCLDCGVLVQGASRCETCAAEYARRVDARRDKSRRELYKGDYRKRARAIRESAVSCWICKDGYRENDPWQADHLIPDDPSSPLAAAHRSCNTKRMLEARAAQREEGKTL